MNDGEHFSALEDNKIKPAGQPKLDLKIYGEDKDLEYVMSVTELPKVELKSVENIKYDEYSVKIDAKETDKRIEDIAKSQDNFKDVAEDVKGQSWPVKNWYREKEYLIKDGDFIEKKTLRERVPTWGALHFGERTLCKDLINSGLMKSTVIDGVVVEVLKARELIEFLNSKNTKAYPYFWLKT